MGTKQEASKYLVILLQIVMMSRGTHLVKKHMSPSREPLDLLVTTQLIRRQTPKLYITVY